MYTVDYFIDKFTKIPENKWTIGTFRKVTVLHGEQRCAQGHCMPRGVIKNIMKAGTQTTVARSGYPEWEALVNLFGYRDMGNGKSRIVIAEINNGNKEMLGYFPQTSPKRRVLAALNHLKKYPDSFNQFKPVKTELKEEKETTTYVQVPAKELVDAVVLSNN